jgi:transcriptional regulator with XRE-family HTH domain
MDTNMLIGKRLREIREAKNLSQGDIEHRTGMIRCYVSRVENGHTVPAIETLEKFARALEVPLYALFYGDGGPSKAPPHGKSFESGKDARELEQLRYALARMPKDSRELLMSLAQQMAQRRTRR